MRYNALAKIKRFGEKMDYIINATDFSREVSVYVAKTTDMIEEMRWKFCEESYFRAVV